MRIAELWIYPLKGARGVRMPRVDVRLAGLRHDRRFMVVASDGAFVTQRSHPRMALVDVAIGASTLTLSMPDVGSTTIPLAPDDGGVTAAASATSRTPRRRVRVWNDDVDAIEVDGDASRLLSAFLETPCSLFFMPDDVVRQVELAYAKVGDRVGFADAYPVLVATRASLADLNGRLAAPVPMNRFRPNVVIDGGSAWDEERHARVRLGDDHGVTLRLPKRCARCQVTTVDQATGIVGKEPLRTLATYRKEKNNVYFAQNAIPDGEGVLAEGDRAEWLEPL